MLLSRNSTGLSGAAQQRSRRPSSGRAGDVAAAKMMARSRRVKSVCRIVPEGWSGASGGRGLFGAEASSGLVFVRAGAGEVGSRELGAMGKGRRVEGRKRGARRYREGDPDVSIAAVRAHDRDHDRDPIGHVCGQRGARG